MEEPSLHLDELARLLGGELLPPAAEDSPSSPQEGTPFLTGVAALPEAGPSDISFFSNPKYLPALKTTRAGCVLVPRGFSEAVGPRLIAVDNPSVAFSAILARFAPPESRPEPGIDPTAVLADSALVGEDVSIGPNVVIGAGARIGARTVLQANVVIGHGATIGEDGFVHPNVTIAPRCRVGHRVILHSGTVIGSDGFGYERVNGKHVKIPQTGIVQIDDDVEIGANTTIDRARFGRTWIGEGTKIDNLVQIAHNVVIGKRCIIVSQVGISGSSRLGDDVTLAGQVGVVGHIEIGSGTVVAAQAGVSKSIPARGVWWGTPASPIREEKEKVALINRLPKLLERIRKLEAALEARQP